MYDYFDNLVNPYGNNIDSNITKDADGNSVAKIAIPGVGKSGVELKEYDTGVILKIDEGFYPAANLVYRFDKKGIKEINADVKDGVLTITLVQEPKAKIKINYSK